MPGILEALAALSKYIPSVEKPKRQPSLPARLAWTFIVVVLYLVMGEIPLLGVPIHPTGAQSPTLTSILLGASMGTLMTLGIGPIVTAGIVLEVLVGGGLVNLDLTKPRDRAIFMGAQRTLSLLFAAFEASMYAMGCAFWATAMGGGLTGCPATLWQRVLVVIQLVIATLILMWFDEMCSKGWGIGSALSLFIVASVAKGMFWALAGPVQVAPNEYYGFLAQLVLSGNPASAIIRYNPRIGYLPDLIGFIATLVIIAVLVYMQLMRVDIPVTSSRYGGIRTRIPLQFVYVTNIPILFVGILVAELRVFASVAASMGPNPLAYALAALAYYATPPRGVIELIHEPVRAVTSMIIWVLLSILFGFIWVEVAGLSPEKQAENLIKSGLEVPGMRRNVKLLAKLLEKYIYPLTLVSSVLVGIIAVLADYFGAYGTGSGLVLAVGIVYNFYMLLLYERTLEMYPTLRRLISG